MTGFFRALANRWRTFYCKSSIQMILSLSFTAVAVIGLIFMGLTLFLRFSASNNALLAENSLRVLTQVNLNLDSYLRSMMRVSDTVYYRVIKNADLTENNLDDKIELIYESNRDMLVSIAVFAQNGNLVSVAPLATMKKGIFPHQADWFVSAVKKIENLHFSTPHVQNLFEDPNYRYRWVVSLSRQVELTRAGSIESGVLLVDMSFGGIEQICKDVKLSSSGGYIYLIDSNGEMIYHPRQQLIYAGLQSENNSIAATYRDGIRQEDFAGTRRQVMVKTVGYTGWKLVGVVPLDNIWSNYGQLFLFFLFVVLFSIFLLVFINLYLSERISVPIKALERFVKALEGGQEGMDFEVSGPYEVEHLGRSINSMVSTMRHLMADIILQEEQKRRSELDVLQSQINPHFLYNTLDSVVWMTENGRTEESILMVTSLARFFRLSLSGGKKIIPIGDELEHAKHYLTIQKMRYKNRFTTEMIAEGDVAQLYTIKLVIQPILENAIYHGMAYADGEGEIILHAFREKSDVLIEVTDNGPGMPPEVVNRLLDSQQAVKSDTATAKGSGIGLRNVHQRLLLTFGESYGLTIFSEPDAGTTVRIRLPAINQSAVESYETGGSI